MPMDMMCILAWWCQRPPPLPMHTLLLYQPPFSTMQAHPSS